MHKGWRFRERIDGGFRFAFLLFFLAALGPLCAESLPVFDPAPAIYKEKLLPLLTPSEKLIKECADFTAADEEGLIVLNETVNYLGEDGVKYVVFHTIYKPLNASGVTSVEKDTFTFKKNFQRVYLIKACTIQPDGKVTNADKDGVFLKTPQNEAENSIYNDAMDLTVIFPNVKPGYFVEQIILVEEKKLRIPGHFSQTYSMSSYWPSHLRRFVVDLPKSYADRLKITKVGSDVPTPTVTKSGTERQQFAWVRQNIPSENYEESRAPDLQVGPLVSITTVPNWDGIADWYNILTSGTDQLSAVMKAKVDAWTKDVKDPEEILRILHGHVAFDVRYVGIELGEADYQPHTSESVWDRQYGDCKDKSNLLRAMLAYKGIPSWLTLVSTDHAGLVHKESPNYRIFTHCILAVKRGESYVFCDPTITFGVPGLLSGQAADREALVIKGKQAEWVRTPPLRDEAITYTYDLQLQPSGELTGWVTLEAAGYYAASYAKYYQDMTKEQQLSDFQGKVRQSFPNADVVDIEPFKEKWNGPALGKRTPFVLRAYMIQRGIVNQGETSTSLKFPSPDSLLPDIKDYKTRKFPTFQWRDLVRITTRIKLLPGWSAEKLPAPYQADSPVIKIQAGWSQNKETLTASFSATIKQSLLPPADMVTLGNAVTNLKVWSDRPLTLTATGKETAAKAPSSDAELAQSLPVMPTGEGQINLINTEFPEDGNVAARRIALGRIAAQFPNDKKTIVEAAALLSSLDLNEKKWDDVLTRLRGVLEANRSAVDLETTRWVEYLIARALEGQGKLDEARAGYLPIAEDKKASPFRRSWAYYRLGLVEYRKDPVKALDMMERSLEVEYAPIAKVVYEDYPVMAMRSDQSARLKERLKKMIEAKPENLEETLLVVAQSPLTLKNNSKKAEALQLLTLLEGLSSPETTGATFAQELKKMRTTLQSDEIYAKLQADLKQALAQFPEVAELEKKLPVFSSKADARKTMENHENANEDGKALGCRLRMAIGYPVSDHFPDDFWQCVNYLEWSMRLTPSTQKEQFFSKLVELGSQLPCSTDGYTDTKLIYARVIERKGRRQQATMIYQALLDNAEVTEGFRGVILERNGINWEELGDTAKALESYKAAEKFLDQNSARRAVLRASFLRFDEGNKAEAFRLVQLLTPSEKLKPFEQLRDILPLIDGATEPPAYWEQWRGWWPQWQALEKQAGGGAGASSKVAPAIASKTDLLKELGTARQEKNAKKILAIARTLAYASRYYPASTLAFSEALLGVRDLVPDRANDVRLLTIAMLQPATFPNPEQQRQRILKLLINYVDSNQPGKALELMAKEGSDVVADSSSVSTTSRRVWALAAIAKKQELDSARRVLEKDLKETTGYDHRSCVSVLADVCRAQGKTADEISLLEAEIVHPEVTADAATLKQFKARLDNLRNASTDSKKLADAVNAWLKVWKPIWWDYAEPKSVDDPRMVRLDDLLKSTNNEWSTPEWIKAGLLAPASTKLSVETQERAVLKALTFLLNHCSTYDEQVKLVRSVVQNDAFSPLLRNAFLCNALMSVESSDGKAAFAEFSKWPQIQSLSEAQLKITKRMETFMPVDRTSPKELTAYVEKLTQQPMDSLDLGFVQDVSTYLLQLGQLEPAEAIYRASAKYTLAPDAGMTRPELQLTLLKKINAAKGWKPLAEAFRTTILSFYKPEAITKPKNFDQRSDRRSFVDLSPEEATQYRLYLIKIHQEPPNSRFWMELMNDLKRDNATVPVRVAWLKAGLSAAREDAMVAMMFGLGFGQLDLDDPAQWQKMQELMAPYRDPAKYPQSAELIRLLDMTQAVRVGKTVDLESLRTGMKSATYAQIVAQKSLEIYQRDQAWEKLKTLLSGLPADQIMSPMLLPTVLPAMEKSGLKEEAQLARETLQQKASQDLLACWYEPGDDTLHAVTRDMEALQNTQWIPATFDAFIEKNSRPQAFRSYRLQKAVIEKDWNAAITHGRVIAKEWPTHYTFYWPLGRALAETGNKDEAIKMLQIYCRYSLDEVTYPEAKELLAKLSKTTQ